MKIAEELKARHARIEELMKKKNDLFNEIPFDFEALSAPHPELDAVEAELKTVADELDKWRKEHENELNEWYKSCGAYINPKWYQGHPSEAKWVWVVSGKYFGGEPYTREEAFDELKALGLR